MYVNCHMVVPRPSVADSGVFIPVCTSTASPYMQNQCFISKYAYEKNVLQNFAHTKKIYRRKKILTKMRTVKKMLYEKKNEKY